MNSFDTKECDSSNVNKINYYFLHNDITEYKLKQTGAELCQAQFKLGLAKPIIAN